MANPRKTGPRTLLVGISNPDTANHLVRLSALVTREMPSEILLTHVVTVASQISLTTGQSSPEVVRARDFLQEVKARASDTGLRVRALVEIARSVEEGLLAAAESHRAEMILVGFSEKGADEEDLGEEERFDRTMHRVARKSAADVVVAKFRGDRMRRVLVPVAAEARLQVTGLLCRALGAEEENSLTFLHVVESGASEEEARARLTRLLERKGVASLGPLVVVPSDTPVETIVEEAAAYDLMVVGPSGRPGFLSTIFSNKAQRIAEEAPASVLLAWNRTDAGG